MTKQPIYSMNQPSNVLTVIPTGFFSPLFFKCTCSFIIHNSLIRKEELAASQQLCEKNGICLPYVIVIYIVWLCGFVIRLARHDYAHVCNDLGMRLEEALLWPFFLIPSQRCLTLHFSGPRHCFHKQLCFGV